MAVGATGQDVCAALAPALVKKLCDIYESVETGAIVLDAAGKSSLSLSTGPDLGQ